MDAIQGALGTVCEAVDRVVTSSRHIGESEEKVEKSKSSGLDPIQRAFVAIRPPGHHCGEDTPSGFCFVNNVAVAAAHGECHLLGILTWSRPVVPLAHLQHGVQRIVIFDIDLHHGMRLGPRL